MEQMTRDQDPILRCAGPATGGRVSVATGTGAEMLQVRGAMEAPRQLCSARCHGAGRNKNTEERQMPPGAGAFHVIASVMTRSRMLGTPADEPLHAARLPRSTGGLQLA